MYPFFGTLSTETAPEPAKAFMRKRQEKFWSQMKPGSIAIFPAAPELHRNRDITWPFWQDGSLAYLTGWPESGAAFVMTKFERPRKHRKGSAPAAAAALPEASPAVQPLLATDVPADVPLPPASSLANLLHVQKQIWFVTPKERAKEIWTGFRVGLEGARKEYFGDRAYAIAEFEERLTKLLSRADTLYYCFGINAEIDEVVRRVWLANGQKELINSASILDEMRMVKDANEIELLREAGRITGKGHIACMRACRPGLREYALKAVMERAFMSEGCQGLSFPTIMASGASAVVLHAIDNRDVMKSGTLVLMDAGGHKFMPGDVSRTIPVNGRFTEDQAALYQVVLDAKKAAVKACRAGARLRQVHLAASMAMRKGLIRLGILPADSSFENDRRIERAKKRDARRGITGNIYKPILLDFFMHGTSHWIGVDCHDVGNYDEPTERKNHNTPNKMRLLVAGNVISIEPGVYIAADDTRVDARWRGIGIRIEDDYLVTADGCENLTAGIPEEIADIEAIMAGGAWPVKAKEADKPLHSAVLAFPI